MAGEGEQFDYCVTVTTQHGSKCRLLHEPRRSEKSATLSLSLRATRLIRPDAKHAVKMTASDSNWTVLHIGHMCFLAFFSRHLAFTRPPTNTNTPSPSGPLIPASITLLLSSLSPSAWPFPSSRGRLLLGFRADTEAPTSPNQNAPAESDT